MCFQSSHQLVVKCGAASFVRHHHHPHPHHLHLDWSTSSRTQQNTTFFYLSFPPRQKTTPRMESKNPCHAHNFPTLAPASAPFSRPPRPKSCPASPPSHDLLARARARRLGPAAGVIPRARKSDCLPLFEQVRAQQRINKKYGVWCAKSGRKKSVRDGGGGGGGGEVNPCLTLDKATKT